MAARLWDSDVVVMLFLLLSYCAGWSVACGVGTADGESMPPILLAISE